jgi:Tc toxin complex TcA C-terminal TcB-binding domain/Neuraminidase-like domain/Salmonella virulence plasmid 28.1kDa A protein
MRFEHDGLVLWYGTPDASAPTGPVAAASRSNQATVRIVVGVQPASVSNNVQVTYRVNEGTPASVKAVPQRQDLVRKTQYFVAKLPAFQVGDKIDYIVLARAPGRQVPTAGEAATYPVSFTVVAAPAEKDAKFAAESSKPAAVKITSDSSASAAPSGTSAGKSSSSPDSSPSSASDARSSSLDEELSALLAASPTISAAMRARFISLYNANEKDMADFWDDLAKDAQLGRIVPQLQLVLQLGTLTLDNPDLVAKLIAQFHPSSIRDLTKLDRDELIKIITEGKIQVPAKIADTTTPATIARYADAIAGALEEAFPADSVAKALSASTDATHQAIANFLSKSPDFDIEKEKIDDYLAAHPAALKGMSADQASDFADRLKATQRLSRVTKDGEAIRKLMEHGLDSSYKIASMPEGSFAERYAEDLGGDKRARQIHANATTISALTTHIIRQVQENSDTGIPWMIAGGDKDAKKVLSQHIPNWQTLFGSASSCQCAECCAIDGPAAYFVSLLEFLKRLGKNKAGHTPLDVLIGNDKITGRRPDLANLKLNCSNADTPLPYVDLVNEIMESYVAHSKLSAATAHDTPADATPEALSVNPEYLQTPDAIKAYETLNDNSVVYPFSLPFDRYLETARNYLDFLGISRYELLKEFGLPQAKNDAASPQLAAEFLRISEAEYPLITNQDFSGKSRRPKDILFKYFGYSANDHDWQKKSHIEQVPEFLSRTDLAYPELLELLETQYLNPRQAITLEISSGTDTCDITAMRIANVGDFLPSLPAFLRLKKKLGWRTAELDYALRAFQVSPGVVKADNPRPVPPNFLLVVAQVEQLRRTLNLTVEQTVSLWHDINTDGRASLYNSLFQNKAVINPPDPGLRLLYQAPLGSMPAPLPKHWSDGTAQDQCTYDNETRLLQFAGCMTDIQRDDLLKWASDHEDAVVAVQALYAERWYDGIEIVGTGNSRQASPSENSEKDSTPSKSSDSIGNHVQAILAALRISSSDLTAIGQDAGYCDSQAGAWAAGSLTLSNLSMLYRYAILAQLLRLPVTDLITLKNLTGLQPFNTSPASVVPVTQAMVQFVATAKQVIASPFMVSQLAYLYGYQAASANRLAPLQATFDSIASTILVGLQSIASANAFSPDPAGTALRKKLTVLLPSAAQVDAVMGLLNGSAVYTSGLASLPTGVTLPAGQVSYATTLTVGGIITARDVLFLTMTSSALAGSPVTLTYTVQASDTLNTVAAAFAGQINSNPTFAATGVSATASGTIISLSVPLGLTPAWTVSATPTGASETLTLGGDLICTGPMTDATAAALRALSSDQGFSNAVNDLYNQAQNVLTENLAFLLPSGSSSAAANPAGNSAWQPVVANLIDVPLSSIPADRYNYVLSGLLASLTSTQSRNLVKQTLTQSLGMDSGVVDLLLDGNTNLGWPQGLLPSIIDPKQSAMSDFLGGLSATYQAAATSGGAQAVQIDPGVDLDGTEPTFQGAQWRAKLLAPKTGAYRFAVPVSSSSSTTQSSNVSAPQITLTIEGQPANPVTPGGASNPVNLTAGQLYDIALSISNPPPSAVIALQWCLEPAPLSTLTTIPPQSFMPCAADGSYPTLALLYRLAVLINGFSMSASDLAYLSTHAEDFAGVDPVSGNSVAFSLAGIPAAASSDTPALFNQWGRLNALYGLKSKLPVGNLTLFDIFGTAAALSSTSPPGTLSSLLPTVQQVTGWNQSDIQTLTGATGFNPSIAEFRNEIFLVQLATCTSICSRIGVSAQQLFAWANPGVSDLGRIAQDIQNTVKAKYDDSTWLTVGKPLNDKLRERSKEALIAYTLHQTGYTNSDDLYGFFLIDVAMCTCMVTSRLVQASAAVQLFVQRCLLNLESDTGHPELDVSPSAFSAEDVQEWTTWRKNYRVWQAAVEMMMYPENWIIPELRPDKTPFFEDLETALLQGEVTEGNVEAAFLDYLRSLQQVARLEIAGVCTDDDPESGDQITHVVGRTFTTPHVYFYRQLDNNNYTWTPWEQIDADISGDTLVPVVWDRRLLLIWPVYNEVTDPTNPNQTGPGSPTITSQPGSGSSSSTSISQPPPTLKSLQIQLAWSEYKDGQWTSKQVTTDSLTPADFTDYSNKLDTSAFVYTAIPLSVSQDQLVVMAYVIYDLHSPYLKTALVQTSNAVGMVSQLVSEADRFLPWYGNSSINFNVGSWNPNAIAQAVQAASGALSMFTSVVQTDRANRGAVATAASNITQVQNTLSSSSQLHPSDMQTILNLLLQAQGILRGLQKEQPYTLEPLGSFTFDGVQGSIEIDLAPTVELEQFPSIANLYRSQLGQSTREFLYQNIYREDAGLSLAVSGEVTSREPKQGKPHRHAGSSGGRASRYPSGSFWPPLKISTLPKPKKPVPDTVDLLAASKHISSFDISFPEERIPSYAIDLSAEAFQKIVFFADRRRTYLLASSLPSVGTRIKHKKHADHSSHAAAKSFYFFNHYHPWIGHFIQRQNWQGIPYLLDPTTQALDGARTQSDDDYKFDFSSHYGPSHAVAKPYPKESVDFNQTSPELKDALAKQSHRPFVVPAGDSAYSIYNWEIFFYIPLFIATRLSQNQQFEAAQTWFHYIFNPTQDPRRKGVPHDYQRETPNGYWNFQPLNQLAKDGGLQDLLDSVKGSTNAALNAQWNAWSQDPFEPDVIARLRPVAYQKTVVMKYLDNLIRWGDNLFGQNTRESIYEATQIYILADEILGERPITLPPLGTILDQTYSDLVKDKINQMGNAQVQLENAFPFAIAVAGKISKKRQKGKRPKDKRHREKRHKGGSVLATTISTPYFCTPANGALLGYYDTVADRLYKIRHCMNIQGQVEQLPLFAPPISPGLLEAAEAAGVDLSSLLNDINAAVPYYRFTFMLSKALELCGELRSLGGSLLSALEKFDAERIAVLRAGQELSVLKAVRHVKELQVQEANANLAGLQATKAVTTARQTYYQGLVQGGLSGYETGQVAAMTLSEVFKIISQAIEGSTAAAAVIPQVNIGINGAFGSPSAIVSVGGQQASGASSAVARAFSVLAEASSFTASMLGMMGGWDRRAAEWAFQLETATLELAQIEQQITAANFRVQIATQDLNNQDLQIANSTAMLDTLKSKFTNEELYSWMVNEISGIFFQCYQMTGGAYDLAKRAEACYRFELGIKDSNFIKFGYWDSLKKGLLSGEKLFEDLKRLENAYLDQNKREYEITKSISLLLLDPFALISLKLTGACLINLPEAYFDMDYPGHYMRRLRSVGLTIPCVTGPYTSVNCTLTLLQSKIRMDNSGANPHAYPEQPIASDSRFCYNFAATDSIATSTAQNDSGMFEVNFRDERYLPFEGAGVISQWKLCMPPDCNAFDFETITDLVLNIRYTARDGGDALRAAAKSAAILPPRLAQTSPPSGPQPPQQVNLQRGFSLRHEYPTEWYKFMQPPAAGSPTLSTSMQINLSSDRFPFQYRGKPITITRADLFILLSDSNQSAPQAFSLYTPNSLGATPNPIALSAVDDPGGAPHFAILNPPAPSPAAHGAPNCWILQYAGDLSQLAIVDMFLICAFTAN